MTQELQKVALLLDLLTYTTHYKSIDSEFPDRNLHYRGKKDWKGKNGKEKKSLRKIVQSKQCEGARMLFSRQ